jgi:hypothetical protein
MARRIVRMFVTPLPALIIAAVLALSSGAVAAVNYTSKPAFCTTCHEMKPYYQAWSAGPHKGVSCISCHVDPGAVAQTSHKVVALKEVYDHVATSPKFPSGKTDVPNARCLACHKDLPAVTSSGFKHAEHVKQATCVSCHPDAGHNVSPQALAAAGILAKVAVTVQTTASAESTTAAHVKIACTKCHNLATTPCAQCHRPPHTARGACDSCHRAGPSWAFAHPSSKTCLDCHTAPVKHFGNDCARCHDPLTPFAKTTFTHDASATACATCHPAPPNHFKPACTTCHSPGTAFAATVFKHSSTSCADCHDKPAKHVGTGAACATCHTDMGKSWAFTHPSSGSCTSCHSAPRNHVKGSCSNCHSPSVKFSATRFTHSATSGCESCHRVPGGHRTSGCSSCHKQAGRSWAFSHPNRNDCSACHKRPGSHFSGTCSNCHKLGVAFAKSTFRHSSSTSCGSCHRAPSGHNSGGCATCHKRAGSSWAFSHPGSTACASCHKAPSSHYGTSCSGCHSPSRSWSSASFNHPGIPGGEHTYKSFACTKCHPSGYSSHYCSCHGGNPPSGD